MKFDLGKLVSIASFIAPLVKRVQTDFKGAKGLDKHEVVVQAAKELLPIVEGGVGKDLLDNVAFFAALDALIAAEKTLLRAKADVDAARANVEAFIASTKGR